MEIRYLSDVGRKRKNNQDYTQVFTNKNGRHLAILADGMGGHRAGDVASRLTVETIGNAWMMTDVNDENECEAWLNKKIEEVNREVYRMGQKDEKYFGMGTTIVCVGIFDNIFTLAHVGDSRAYLIRKEKMYRLTEDHSLVTELVKSGEISEKEAETHPRKNVLTRTIGMPGDIVVDSSIHKFEYGDFILLNSDGLTNMVSEDTIYDIVIGQGTISDKVNHLVDLANANGGMDNITALLIWFGGER
jgi:protein phosphatase